MIRLTSICRSVMLTAILMHDRIRPPNRLFRRLARSRPRCRLHPQHRGVRMDARLTAYLPHDRRQALARGESLADRTHGVALFADISGFTPLTEALASQLGPRRGAEALTFHLDRVYAALIAEVERFGG